MSDPQKTKTTRRNAVVRAFVRWLPLHATIPVMLGWLHEQAGSDAVYLALAAIHAGFPVIYMVSRALGRYSTGELLLLLALNHAVMFSVAAWVWWLA